MGASLDNKNASAAEPEGAGGANAPRSASPSRSDRIQAAVVVAFLQAHRSRERESMALAR